MMESDSINAAPHGSNGSFQRMRPSHGRTCGPTRRSTKGQWTIEEDEVLRKAVQRFNGKNWKKIAECFKDRTDVQCLHRWQKVLNPALVKGPWTKEEDETMMELVKKYGPKKWSTIAQHLPGRIGKQCRERWHNHLNPTINKEAWTQEEELTLIRAHQIYGNKWAELTKFLPGRTDNSIKNHWNSSVKKKLDSYLASGLLAQFQGLPHVSEASKSVPSPCSTVPQSSGDDSSRKDVGTEMEEISECSQSSSVFGIRCVDDIPSVVRENCQMPKAWSHGKDPTPNFEEVGVFSMPDVPCEMGGSSNFLHHSCVNDGENYGFKDWNMNHNELPTTSSMDLGEEFLMECMGASENHDMPFQFQNRVSVNASSSTDKPEHMISEDDCYRVIFPDAEMDGHCLSVNPAKDSNITDFNEPFGSLLQPLDHQDPDSSRSYMLGATCSQPSPGPTQIFHHGSMLPLSSDFNQFEDMSHQNPEMELENSPDDGILFTNDSITSPCQSNEHKKGAEDELDNENDSLKLVPVDISNLASLNNKESFATPEDPGHANDSLKLVSDNVTGSMPSSNIQTCPPEVESLAIRSDGNDAGSLFYEPPRFPSLDIPFFSCDLIQPGDLVQQEFSPLGIRQLMMSSLNCFSPLRLWDSPKHDDSPEAVLKSAAKTFSGTPSILKKRNRDLVSPMSEKRSEKKLGTDMDQVIFSNLARDFSRLDVMFSEKENKAPLTSLSSHAKDKNIELSHDKENRNQVPNTKANSQNVNEKSINDEEKFGNAAVNAKSKSDSDAMMEIVSRPLGVLVEHDMNDMLFFSPDRSGNKSNVTFGKHCIERLESKSNQGSVGESSVCDPRLSVVSSMVSKTNNENQLDVDVSAQFALSLHPSEDVTRSNDACAENLSIFGETPFKRSFDSPSAWKSPWFVNTFLPGPRVDTDITIEDIGYFLSPGDRSVDAIELMKQLSEHSAAALADAQVVLGTETPETLLRCRRSIDRKQDQGNSALRNQPSTKSHLESNVLSEKRILDFSDCGTPGKSRENSKI